MRNMSDDLVDRILKRRATTDEEGSVQAKLAVQRSRAVLENQGALWNRVTAQARAMAEKYSVAFPRRPVYFSQGNDPRQRFFEVKSEAFPLVRLSVSFSSPRSMEFSVEKTVSSFSEHKTSSGRIDVKADDDCNILMRAMDGTMLLTGESVADYLLEKILA